MYTAQTRPARTETSAAKLIPGRVRLTSAARGVGTGVGTGVGPGDGAMVTTVRLPEEFSGTGEGVDVYHDVYSHGGTWNSFAGCAGADSDVPAGTGVAVGPGVGVGVTAGAGVAVGTGVGVGF
jgi:hypothetical protein